MIELLRTNDIVHLGYLTALLDEAGIDFVVFDQHASVIEGSIGAIQRRVMVADEDMSAASRLLAATLHPIVDPAAADEVPDPT